MSEALKILQEQCRGAANASGQSSKEDFKRITDYESFITARAKRRKPSALREISELKTMVFIVLLNVFT